MGADPDDLPANAPMPNMKVDRTYSASGVTPDGGGWLLLTLRDSRTQLCGGGYWVAVRARSRVPAVVPMYMSRVMRMLAWPARRETSAGSMFQVNRAVVQNTCRRLCQVQGPFPSGSRHPAAR